LLSFVSSVLTVPVAMPVVFAISEAVIGPSWSASSTLALFCARVRGGTRRLLARGGAGRRPSTAATSRRARSRAASRLGTAGGSAGRPGTLAPPAHPRARRPFEPTERVAQPFELLAEALMFRKLTLDLLHPRLHRLDDRAHIRDWRHLTPGFGVGAPSD
jgi:hypothetical protein